MRRSLRSADAPGDAAAAVAAALAPPGQIASLILPADVAWTDGAEVAVPVTARRRSVVPDDVISEIAAVLHSAEPTVILLGGDGLRKPALMTASRIAEATGARLIAETFPARHERGAGIPAVEKLAYLGGGSLWSSSRTPGT